MKHYCFAFLNLFSFKLQNLGELMGNVAQTNVEEEGAEENQRWLG